MEEKFWHLELFKEDSSCFDAIANWIVRGLCQHYWVLSRIDFEFFEDMSPDGLHVVPVSYYAVLHRIAQLENALEFLLQKSKGMGELND